MKQLDGSQPDAEPSSLGAYPRKSPWISWLYAPALLITIYALLHFPFYKPSAVGHGCGNSLGFNAQSFPKLIEATTEDLITGLEAGLFSSVDLVNAYVARITEVNPILHAVTELNPDALSIAATLDAERSNGTTRGPLHGIPILIKDNIATMDQMNNTAGSYALLGSKVPADSTVAAKLRKAGAVILGKTNLSQWANFRSLNGSSGWSAYGGQVYGAYYPGQDPSGSSSGSGVASSLGLALASLGTETAGSIVSPSHANNLVGIKPTVGLTSRYLVIPISERQDTVGPMARRVKDAAYLLQAIAGIDANDNYTSTIPFKDIPDYVGACQFSALKGKRIGVPRNALEVSNAEQPAVNAFNAALDVLRAAGASIVENTNYTAYPEFKSDNTTFRVAGVDFLANLPAYTSKLTNVPIEITDLPSLRNFTISYALEDYPDRDVGQWDLALSLNVNNTSPEFWTSYQANLRIGGPDGVTGAIRDHSLSALVLPTSSRSAYGLPALIGSPVITVPLGSYPPDTPVRTNDRGNLNATAPNVPFGISFIGERFSEELLVGLAYAFEQRTRVRDTIRPYIEPMTELVDVVAKRKAEPENKKHS